MKKCTKCGYEGESNFCPKCGASMEEVVELKKETTAKPAVEKNAKDKKSVIIVVLVITVVVLAGIVLMNSGVINNASTDITDWSDSEDVSLAENQGRNLPGGTYVVGEDIPAGKYMLEYTTTMSEDDYWSNDYLYITFSGSEGENETLGGTKFDDRVGSVEYEDAVGGEPFYVTLNNGDTIKVNSEYGDWTY